MILHEHGPESFAWIYRIDNISLMRCWAADRSEYSIFLRIAPAALRFIIYMARVLSALEGERELFIEILR